MRFDLTKEIVLDAKSCRTYRILQISLYFIALIATIYLGTKIMFPSADFSYSFSDMSSNKNTIADVRSSAEVPLKNGNLPSGQASSFDTSLVGSFSKAVVNFTLASKSAELSDADIEVRKSYGAFFYPEGQAIGFKDGSLLKNRSDYYLVSDGKLRKFANPNIIPSLGYSPDAFIQATPDELRYNPAGDPIVDNNNYPDNSLFKIGDDYYMMQSGTLEKFVSSTAFLDQYTPAQAVARNDNFLSQHAVSQNMVGFSDGSLVAYGNSIYIISDGQVLPIDNPVTFTTKGYDWNSVIKASPDEIALYQKAKLFNIKSMNPDGTIFATEKGQYYMIQNAKKHLLPSEDIAKSWLAGRQAIPVSIESLDMADHCALKKDLLSLSRSYSCQIPIYNLQQLDGADYEFSIKPGNNIKISSIDVTFLKDINFSNFKDQAKGFLSGIKNNYVPAQQPAPAR